MNSKKYALRALAATGAAFLALLLAAGVTLFLNVTVPYQPFSVRSVHISQTRACTGANITVTIDRKFVRDFDSLKIKESWIDKTGRPVASESGVLPASILHPTNGYQARPSPLLTTAPDAPGVYRVMIHTRSQGTRWAGLKARGTSTLYSDNHVRVVNCPTSPTQGHS